MGSTPKYSPTPRNSLSESICTILSTNVLALKMLIYKKSKLRFFELRKPKISSCYTIPTKKGLSNYSWTAP